MVLFVEPLGSGCCCKPSINEKLKGTDLVAVLGQDARRTQSRVKNNIGALIIRIGFGGYKLVQLYWDCKGSRYDSVLLVQALYDMNAEWLEVSLPQRPCSTPACLPRPQTS